ncbi:zinc-binding dehydrogenase [Archangium sp. Cb G35]|uniref:zinc-dependent alcohol dehydrogenase family protein n=1 Tax=Archangium sp. Cb G35 TaxID=1920190 RepID=UPI000AF36076|nr:zinc-binding dehydrogenase [Archangium sp. Cb G35]
MAQAAARQREEVMRGVILPGNRTVEFKEFPVPQPQHGQVLVKIMASAICGSDIRAIYRAHIGEGAERYIPGMIAGHEPCGQIAAVGPGCQALKVGDRVSVYHISGCGVCDDCRHGYQISCTSPVRAAYGWQRHGGHAPWMLADERDCIPLPASLSYVDGAMCACGVGTAWESLTRIGVNGGDALLVTGLGPVGMGVAMLGKALGANKVIGTEMSPVRRKLAMDLGLVDEALDVDDRTLSRIKDLTRGRGCEASIDCSGTAGGRLLALQATRQWGRCAFVGEGGKIEFDVSPLLIHPQITLFGSWVTSLRHMSDLLDRLDRWGLHPEKICTTRLPLSEAARGYKMADQGEAAKVCFVFDGGV